MPPDRAETRHITARIPADHFSALAEIARRADRSVSAELRRLIRTHVEEHRQAAFARVVMTGNASDLAAER